MSVSPRARARVCVCVLPGRLPSRNRSVRVCVCVLAEDTNTEWHGSVHTHMDTHTRGQRLGPGRFSGLKPINSTTLIIRRPGIDLFWPEDRHDNTNECYSKTVRPSVRPSVCLFVCLLLNLSICTPIGRRGTVSHVKELLSTTPKTIGYNCVSIFLSPLMRPYALLVTRTHCTYTIARTQPGRLWLPNASVAYLEPESCRGLSRRVQQWYSLATAAACRLYACVVHSALRGPRVHSALQTGSGNITTRIWGYF